MTILEKLKLWSGGEIRFKAKKFDLILVKNTMREPYIWHILSEKDGVRKLYEIHDDRNEAINTINNCIMRQNAL